MILQRIRFFIWAVAAMMIAAAFLVATLNAVQTNGRLVAQMEQDHRAQAAARTSASNERQALLDGQRRLEVKYDALLATQSRLVSYLNGRGIFIPRYVLEAQSDDSSNDGDDGDGSRARSSSSTGGSGKQLPPKSGSAPDPVPHSSGRSGKGQGTGGGHDKGHGSSSSSGGSKKAKGHAKAKGHKDH